MDIPEDSVSRPPPVVTAEDDESDAVLDLTTRAIEAHAVCREVRQSPNTDGTKPPLTTVKVDHIFSYDNLLKDGYLLSKMKGAIPSLICI